MKFSVKTMHCTKTHLRRENISSGRVFLSGVMVLTLSTILVKVIGLLYKIPMLRLLGSEGMGYFNAAYEWYATLCVIATSGLPLASSILIARAGERKTEIQQIERLSWRVFGCLGVIGTLFLLFGASTIARAIGSPNTKFAIAAVAPTMLFSCLSGAYRGYFQGHQNMIPTAVSQVIEAAGKLLFGLLFAFFAKRRGLDTAQIAACAMLGLSLGVAISFVYLAFKRKYDSSLSADELSADGKDCPMSGSRLFRQLLGIAVPITISSSVMNVTRLFDMAMILRRLQHLGYHTAEANALYGGYTTMAVPIFSLIPSLITSVSLALVPTLTAAIKTGDSQTQKASAGSAIRLTALLSLPASFAVVIYSKSILSLLFGNAPEVSSAAPMLSVLAMSIFFSGIITTTNAILQAYGHTRAPICSMLIGSVVKLLGAYVLIGLPGIHIYGAPISTFLCDTVIVGINFSLIAKHTDVLPSLRRALGRPLIVSFFAVGIPGVLYAALVLGGYSHINLFFASVPVTLAIYLVLCLRIGLVGKEELSMLPRGISRRLERICRVSPKNE